MPDASPTRLEDQLSDLARVVHVAVPEGLEAAVLARVAAAPTSPRRGWRRWFAGLLLALLGAGAVASPVGADIRQWLGLPGVSVDVREMAGDDPVTRTPTVPPATGAPDLERAADLVGFTPLVPDALGAPEQVEVSRDARVVSLSWTTPRGSVRLDEFRGDVDPIFWKTTTEAERVSVGLHEALWLPTPHAVEVVSPDGEGRTLPSRLSAPTLLWVDGDQTLRLEGDLDLTRAVEIAESAR